MSYLVLLAIALAVGWWLTGSRASSLNERVYLRRRGYEPAQKPEPTPKVDRDAYLFSLIESLNDLSPFARERAAQELGRISESGNRDPRMLSGLLSALNDSDASVRRAVATALASLGDVEAVEHLRKRVEIEESAPARVSMQKAIEKLTLADDSNRGA
jgi:HEAT repeat protein